MSGVDIATGGALVGFTALLITIVVGIHWDEWFGPKVLDCSQVETNPEGHEYLTVLIRRGVLWTRCPRLIRCGRFRAGDDWLELTTGKPVRGIINWQWEHEAVRCESARLSALRAGDPAVPPVAPETSASKDHA